MKKLSLLLILVLALSLTAPVFANCGHCPKDQECPMQKDGYRKDADDESGQCPIAGKLMKKAHFFLKNADEIGLSEAQTAEIKAIKMEAKKASIRQAAEMQVFEMDLMEKMGATPLDVEGLNAMIDQASAGFASSAKASVASYAKLKAVLTEEQTKKAKEIWKKDSK